MYDKPHINLTQIMKKGKTFAQIHTIHTNIGMMREGFDFGFAFVLDNIE